MSVDTTRSRELANWCSKNMALVCDEEIEIQDQLRWLADEVDRLRVRIAAHGDVLAEGVRLLRDEVTKWEPLLAAVNTYMRVNGENERADAFVAMREAAAACKEKS